jgi:hypothetical protein
MTPTGVKSRASHKINSVLHRRVEKFFFHLVL